MLGELQQLDPPLWVALILLLLALTLVVNDSVRGATQYRQFAQAMETAEPTQAPLIRARFLWRWSWEPWVLTTITCVFILLAPEISLSEIGLTWPDFSTLTEFINQGGSLGGLVFGALAGLTLVFVVGILIGIISWRKQQNSSTDHDGDHSSTDTASAKRGATSRQTPVNKQVEPMLPTHSTDRRAWFALSATAGITEEIMYRGLILLVLTALLPTGPNPLIYVTAVLIFALAHIYQGWAGILSTGILGAVFLALYIATGSVLPGILLHFLADARGGFLKPRA